MKPTWPSQLLVILLTTLFMPATSQAHTTPAPFKQALGSGFTFQGLLQNASGGVNGACDLRFALYDAESGGTRSGEQDRTNVTLTSGWFSVVLDFGADAFSTDRWLETAVRCPSGNGAYTTLAPRQPVRPVPAALTATIASRSPDDFTVNGELWVAQTGIFGGPDLISALSLRSPDLYFRTDPSFNRGDGGRALVHEINDTLAVNYKNDFSGGVTIGGSTRITGELTVEGPTIRLLGNDLYLSGDHGDGGRALVHTVNDTLVINYDNDFSGGVVINNLHTGKVVELNLLTPAQQQAVEPLPFTLGDLLCWDETKLALALCTVAASPLVVAVANAQGQPIVLGAEPIKVVGPVKPGDLLVSSQHPGYATAWTQLQPDRSPPVGVTIAKALEPLTGDTGLVKALVMMH